MGNLKFLWMPQKIENASFSALNFRSRCSIKDNGNKLDLKKGRIRGLKQKQRRD